MIWVLFFILLIWCISNEDDVKKLTKRIESLEEENKKLKEDQ